MNPFRRLESVIAGLVEGSFGRVFRTEVRPMELAHKLAREMDEHATASVSRTYAPNEYSIWLSPRDRARYQDVEQEVIDELCAYLLEHARRENFALSSAPQIAFHTDEDLELGEFGIEARMARQLEPREQEERPRASARRAGAAAGGPAAASSAPHEPSGEAGGTMIFSNAARVRGAVESARGGEPRAKALLVVDGRRVIVPARGAVLGRSRECDVVVDDSSVSRRHAQLRPEGEGWTLEDLGSTNGVRVNGRPAHGPHPLRSGDRIELGSAEVRFEVVR
jgi:Protein of unknown function (DUF3662)/FHA domain